MRLRTHLALGFGLAALVAAPTLAVAQGKIGFVDQRKAVFASKEGKLAEQRVNDYVQEQSEKLRPRQEDLKRLMEEFEKQKYVLSEDALQERKIDIMRRQRELERDAKEIEEDLQIEQVKALQPIQKKLANIISTIGKEQGLSLIVDKATQGLLYYDESLDVTDLVIERLNK